MSSWRKVGYCLVMACAAVFVAGTGFTVSAADLKPSAYVRRNLIGLWDAIDNAGTGQHVAATDVWADLSGNGHDFPLPDSGVTISDTYLQFAKVSALTTVPDLATPGTFCGEACVCAGSDYTTADSTRTIFNNPQLGLYFRNTSGLLGGVYASGAKRYFFYAQTNPTTAFIKEWHTYYLQTSSSGGAISIDGAAPASGKSPFYNDTYTANSNFTVGNTAVTLAYRSVRLYGSHLTTSEVAHNRLVDRVRFDGAALPDNCRVSADGSSIQYCVTIANTSGGELLSVDGGNTWFASANVWADYGSEVTVTVHDSTRFVVWPSMPEGSVFSPDGKSVTFDVTEPTSLAVDCFTPTHMWTGAAGADFADAGNWTDAAGNAVGSAPGHDSSVYIPVGAANQPTASEPIDVAALRIGRLANEEGTATFTSATNAMHHVAGELIVYAGGKMTHTALPGTANAAKDECYKLNVTAQSITIKTGGMIDVSACGYAGAKGPGAGGGLDGSTAAAHGGVAGGQAVGKSYGSMHSPTNCGSGSYHSNYGPCRGGGAVQFVASGDIVLETSASILADGAPGLTKSSGAGGSVWLKCAALKGSGRISASGQNPSYGNGGSGGRIAVWQIEGTDFATEWTGTMEACSGSGGGSDQNRPCGGPGTIYLQSKGEDVTSATVIVDNANKIHDATTGIYYNHYSQGVVVMNGFVELCARTGSDKIGNLIVRKKAHVLVPSGETAQIYGNIDTTGGYTYTVDSAIQMCGPKTATISGSAPYANFVCTEPGKTLLFGTTANDCFEISAGGSLTLTGTEENPVNLFPAGDDPAKLWAMKFGVDAVSDVNYASVSNSNASAGDQAVTAYHSNNLGGNTKWAFTTPAVEGETITWTGAMNDDWTEPSNWDRGRMVKDTDVVVIPSEKGGEAITSMPKISVGNITLNALTVEAGATLTLNGTPLLTVTNSLAVAGALVVASKMKITCTKNVSFAGGSFTAGDSIFLLTENDDQSVNLNNQHFKNLTIRKESGSVIFSEGWEADVFDCASANSLDLTFAAGKTYKAEECGFRGRRADGGQALTLRSSTPESAWNLALGSAQYIAGVDVQDSTATLAAAVVDSSSRNSGRNVNWTFSNTGVTNAFWTGGTGNFNTSGSWDTGVVPDANTRVFVWASPGETKAVTASSAVTVRNLVLLGTDTGKAGLTATKSLTVLGDVDVSANATLTVADPEGNAVNGDVIVRTGGTITHTALSGTATKIEDADSKLKLSIAGNLTVEHDGKIHATGKGYAARTGPCAPNTTNRGSGGHGGKVSQTDGDCYGSVLHPTTCGSGGCESRGGGVVQLNVAGTATVDGEISANGAAGALYASGGGGSVWLVCRSLAGGGLIASNSDPCNCNDGGGGGRVAVEVLQTDAFTGSVEAGGSYPSSSNRTAYDDCGGAGTVYRIGPNQPAGGEISIDNAQIAKGMSSVVMSRIAKTQLPMADDGKPMKAYKDKLLTIGRKARVTITQSMCVGDLNFTASGSILELGTNTLTVSSREHKDGKGWASGITITSNEVGGVCGKIVWKKSGFALIVR